MRPPPHQSGSNITFWGVPIIRIAACWGLYWGALILGNYLYQMLPNQVPFLGFRMQGFRHEGPNAHRAAGTVNVPLFWAPFWGSP